jgi:AraC family transcriptional regulator, transcriptional activator of pobA
MFITTDQPVSTYTLKPDETGNRHFRIYNFEGTCPDHDDLLTPHRKDHYLIAFVRQGGTRQWIDMQPVTLKDNTVYFTGLNQIILKEEVKRLWSTGIAFTQEFLGLQENAALSRLPIILNPQNGHELTITSADVPVIEDMIARLKAEYHQPGEWQQRMLTAHLTVLLTYLSRLYSEQYKSAAPSAEKLLLKRYQEKIEEYYRELHEVGDYAAQLNISAGHLSEVIKAQSGKPAITHIHDRLVLEAKRLLFHTENSVKEIAFDLGFSDASYFNRFFKRETGAPPAEYRAGIRKMYH